MRWWIGFGVALILCLVGVRLYQSIPQGVRLFPDPNTYTVEVTDYNPPAETPDEQFQDDQLSDKHPKFDPELVDGRLEGGWKVNASAAVLRLDVPMLRPDADAELLAVHRSYADAIKTYSAKHEYGPKILPSINLIDGKAKQFDDGLYAAVDVAYYQGLNKVLPGHVALVRRFYEKVGPKSPAAPGLAAALELAEVRVDVENKAGKDLLLKQFEALPVRSKPIGFYTWSPKLGELFRFMRFLQEPVDPAAANDLAKALRDDPALRTDYAKLIGFFSKLTNPRKSPSLLALADDPAFDKPVAFLPAATSKEALLFEKAFPLGLPPDADLMRLLVQSIKSGKVDLKPGADSGWYDRQVYALETMLLPEKGPEHDKLLLTRTYKKRMMEAFQALITKRKETHVRDLGIPKSAAARPLEKLAPRLRLEPAPAYYLRTARAYAFLANFLEATLGADALKSLHGLKADGARAKDLRTELGEMKDLFYGCHLLSCEDVGLKPDLLKDEPVDRARCVKAAEAWLKSAADDLDLAADTRVVVPVYIDRDSVKCWGTLGVRLAKLDVSYATPPSLQDAMKGGAWEPVETWKLESVTYLVPVDEFAEFQLPGAQVLSREEFRAACDSGKTRAEILKAFGR